MEQDRFFLQKRECYFYPNFGFYSDCFIRNINSGLNRMIFPLIGVNSLTIDGGGVLFVFHNFVNQFIIKKYEQSSKASISTFAWNFPS